MGDQDNRVGAYAVARVVSDGPKGRLIEPDPTPDQPVAPPARPEALLTAFGDTAACTVWVLTPPDQTCPVESMRLDRPRPCSCAGGAAAPAPAEPP